MALSQDSSPSCRPFPESMLLPCLHLRQRKNFHLCIRIYPPDPGFYRLSCFHRRHASLKGIYRCHDFHISLLLFLNFIIAFSYPEVVLCSNSRNTGSTNSPFSITPKCRCEPVEAPVFPTSAIFCPCSTHSPSFTRISLQAV